MRNQLFRILATLALGLAVSPARAQDAWPTRGIALIVPFAAGGTTDVVARVVAEGMQQVLGQSIVVDNRAGAGGSTGTAVVARAKPDGYTIGLGTASTLAINPAVYKTLPYDVLADLAPVINLARVPNIMAIHPSLPAANMKEFIAHARERGGALSYASAGVGSVSHLMGEQFILATGTRMAHVPYRGVAPALADAIAGHVQVMYDNLPTTLPLVEGGKLRALAVSSPARLTALPDVPTFRELGLDTLDWEAFFGIVAPAGTPPAIIARLNDAARQTLARKDVAEKLAGQMAANAAASPGDFAAEIRRELARHSEAATRAGIALD